MMKTIIFLMLIAVSAHADNVTEFSQRFNQIHQGGMTREQQLYQQNLDAIWWQQHEQRKAEERQQIENMQQRFELEQLRDELNKQRHYEN